MDIELDYTPRTRPPGVLQNYPVLQAYVDRLGARPAWRCALAD